MKSLFISQKVHEPIIQGITSFKFYRGRASLFFILAIILVGSLIGQRGYAQSCDLGSAPPTALAIWDWTRTSQCNGATQRTNLESSTNSPWFMQDIYKYCPQVNSGCGQAILGSLGHSNTAQYDNAICLYNFYAPYAPPMAYYNHISTVWNPAGQANFYIKYTVPVGKSACLKSFSLKILQLFATAVNFEKQGVTVYRNDVEIYSNTQNIALSNINATPLSFAFPSTSQFCTDGSSAVTFKIVFGLVHRLGTAGFQLQTGYDDITVNGVCAAAPSAIATTTKATCGTNAPNADGKITLSNFGLTDRYDYNEGASYTGTATYASGSTLIPAGGVITNTLPDPGTPKQYTVRVFSATCYKDLTVTLNPAICPTSCATVPAGVVLTANQATCSGTTANNDASIAVTGVTGGDKVGISAGTPYTGVSYATANALASGAYTFTGLNNPTSSQIYTVRVFDGDSCYVDKQVTLDTQVCNVTCPLGEVWLLTADVQDPDSSPGNTTTEDDKATYSLCKDTKTIDLTLSETVAPATGTVGTTDFVWTATLSNEGTMTAKNIQVASLLPNDLYLSSSSATIGDHRGNSGWILDSLQAGQTATLTIHTFALKTGTFSIPSEVQSAFPDNDIDSTPGNRSTTEDDDATASITVTGVASPPSISKEFSPMHTKSNSATRLTLKLVNNETRPVTLTADLVDALPSSPAQMLIAATPALQSTGLFVPVTGITATAGGTSITIPKGTVLSPGLNQLSLNITVPSDGIYTNDIAAGDLKTTAGNNILATSATVMANSTFDIAPLIKKEFNPVITQTSQNSTLTITIENRNAAAITLNQDFVDMLPTGLLANGALSGTCGGTSITGANTEVRMASGTSIASGGCTIVVPVTSSVAGTYTNAIAMNSLLTTLGTNNNLGNEDVAEAQVTFVGSPCTAVGTVSFGYNPASPVSANAAVTVTATATGIGVNSVIHWNSATGVFSNVGINPTVWTAPATVGTYTISATINNALTGYGTCTATATNTIVVQTPPPPTCTNPNVVFTENFGSGAAAYGPALPAGTTNLNYVSAGQPQNGDYALMNLSIGNTGSWHITPDHTGNTNGYAMLINASTVPSEFYRKTVTGLAPNTTYNVSAWLLNLVIAPNATAPDNPILQFNIEAPVGTVVATNNAPTLPQTATPTWVDNTFSFTTGAGITSVDFVLKNNRLGGAGNDLLLDDITFSVCGPTLTIPAAVCPNSATTISSTIGAGYTTPTYQWQTSTDGGTNWSDIAAATSATLTLAPSGANGTQYRLLAAESGNIGLVNARVMSNVATASLGGIGSNLIVNGGFEDFAANGISHVMAGNTMNGWKTIDGGTSGGCNASYGTTPGYLPRTGSWVAELQPHSNGGGCETSLTIDVGIEQTVATTVGKVYAVEFYIMNVTATGGTRDKFEVYVNGVLLKQFTMATNATWTHYYGFYTATSSSTTLRFLNKSDNSFTSFVDDIFFAETASNCFVPTVSGSICPNVAGTLLAIVPAGTYTTPTYQWQTSTDNGITWTNIAGQTTATLTAPATVAGVQYKVLTAESGQINNLFSRSESAAYTIPASCGPTCGTASMVKN